MKLRVSNKGFTIIELIVVIVILGILATIGFKSFSTGGSNDKVRDSRLNNVMAILTTFKTDTGVYPNSSSFPRNYPKTGCSVSGYKALIDCLVALGKIPEDQKEEYLDPEEGKEYEATSKKYQFLYCVSAKANYARIVAFAGDQSNIMLKGLDGKEADKGLRYLSKTSPEPEASIDKLVTCTE